MDSQEPVNPPAPQQRQIPIRDIVINNDSIAVNIMAFMLDLAHRRGAYTFEEAAKIHECIKYLENQNKSKHIFLPKIKRFSIQNQSSKDFHHIFGIRKNVLDDFVDL